MLYKYPLERLEQLMHLDRMHRLITTAHNEYAMDVEVQLPSTRLLDEDILDSRLLRDFDDFDDGIDDFFDENGDPLLSDDDQDVDMKGLALF
jgi:hypothetical protein